MARIIKDVLLAMSYSHTIGISHRNLRPETVMIDLGKNVGTTKPKNLSIKITDFMQGAIGTPADKILTWDPKTQSNDKKNFGSIAYTAPEAIRGNFDIKSDVWSIGILAFTLLCGETPFTGADEMKIANAILKGNFVFRCKDIEIPLIKILETIWSSRSSLCKDFIKALLTNNPGERPSCQQALALPWL